MAWTSYYARLWRWGEANHRPSGLHDPIFRYGLELEASVADKGWIATKLNPVQLQQLSEAMQSARDFREYVVAGYKSCAITKTQYAKYGARFQTLDNLAREINSLVEKPSLSQGESARAADLISR